MSIPGVTDLTLFVEKGRACFAVIKEEMFKLFYVDIRDTSVEVNYLLSKETVSFMFSAPQLTFEEQDQKLLIKCETGRASEFRQVIVPLRHDYSFELLREIHDYITGHEMTKLTDLNFLRQLAALCKFQKTGVVVKRGWGMIDTPMFKVCRPVSFQDDLVISERALTQFISFTKDQSSVKLGRVNRYTICQDHYGTVFGFVRVRNTIDPFAESYQKLIPDAEYKVDVQAMSQVLFAVQQTKTQEVSLSIDLNHGIARAFERTKGEFVGNFFSELISSRTKVGAVTFNFKVMKCLLTTNVNFSICVVKVYKSIVSFELSNGLIVMVKRGE